MSTAVETPQKEPHVVVFPLIAQGHIIPTTEMAKILALRGCRVTMVTTPLNSIRYEAVMEWSRSLGLNMKLELLLLGSDGSGSDQLSCGLLCENLESAPTYEMSCRFVLSTRNLHRPFEDLVTKDPPNCIISDAVYPWTTEIAKKLNIPRFSFHVVSCFAWYCYYSMHHHLGESSSPPDHQSANIAGDAVPIDGLPSAHPGFPPELVPRTFFPDGMNITRQTRKAVASLVREAFLADKAGDGTIFNTSYEMESFYVDQYRELVGKTVWTIGPVTLINSPSRFIQSAAMNDDTSSSSSSSSSVENDKCLKWLDSKQPRSVIYVCFGTIISLSEQQIIELGTGLESSNYSFLWTVRGETNHIEGGFLHHLQERVKNRGFIVNGWAPQLLILAHPAVGGYMTHCGWNSTIEGIGAGLPLITWPCTFADQAFAEKLVTDVLKVGVSVGNEHVMGFVGDYQVGLVSREKVERAVNRVLGGGDEEKEMRERAMKLGEIVKRSIDRDGSSTRNINLILHTIGCKI